MALHGSAESGFPENIAGLRVKGPEPPVQVADKRQITGCRKHPGMKRSPLLVAPYFLHGVDIKGSYFAQITFAVRHFVEAPIGGQPARAFDQLNRPSAVIQTGLTERRDKHAAGFMIAHGVPVLSAGAGWAARNPFVELCVDDIVAIGDRAG